jgi:ABC-type sugar transport system substrate-binding protein
MLRRFAVVATILAALLAAGCGDSGDEPSGSNDTAAKAAPQGEPAALRKSEPLTCDATPAVGELAEWPVPRARERYRVAMMEVSLAGYYYVSIDYAAKAAAKEAGIDLTTVAAEGYASPDVQLRQVEDILQQGVDALILAPSDPAGAVGVVEKARAAGVPVVVHVTEVASNDVYNVQQDDYTLGRLIARRLVEVVGPDGGEGIWVSGPASTATWVQKRLNGFKDELKEHPGITVHETPVTLVDPAAGLKAFEDTTQSHPDVRWIASPATILLPPSALPARYKGKVPYIGTQYEPDTIEALRAGALDSVFSVEPKAMGRIAVARAVELLNGDEPPRTTCVPAPLYTADDVGTPQADGELIPASYRP